MLSFLRGLSDDQLSIVVFGSLSALSGLGLLYFSLQLLRIWLRSRRLVRVRGTVIAHHAYPTRIRSSSGVGSHAVMLRRPVVQFMVTGRAYQVLSNVGSNVPPPVGTPLRVAYPPGNPAVAEVDSVLSRYFWAGMWAFGLGVTFLIVTGVGLAQLR